MPSMRDLVEPDRVHRTVYTEQAVFDREIDRIFQTVWVYCGHESQIRNPGDYHALQIGRQPMLMVRTNDHRVAVLYNRCPHRGVQICGNTDGNAGSRLVCSYHAWTFDLDGRIKGIPLKSGYDGTRMTPSNPDCSMRPAARVESYRGFVFASLRAAGPSLAEFLGDAKVGIDDLCDRSPLGEVELVPVCYRIMQHSNWKFFMENQLDALHPSVTHQSTGVAAAQAERKLKAQGTLPPLHYHYLSAFDSPLEKWDAVQSINFPRGHGILKGYMGLRPDDADTREYVAAMHAAYGSEKAEQVLGRNIHHALIYPYLSIQPALQQLRCLRPVAPNRTLSEIWHFKLKGVSPGIYRRALWYFNLVNSPATIVNADDLENWTKGQWGLESQGGDWVSFHRNYGSDTTEGGITYSNHGTSEAVMRNQFRAWVEYMAD